MHPTSENFTKESRLSTTTTTATTLTTTTTPTTTTTTTTTTTVTTTTTTTTTTSTGLAINTNPSGLSPSAASLRCVLSAFPSRESCVLIPSPLRSFLHTPLFLFRIIISRLTKAKSFSSFSILRPFLSSASSSFSLLYWPSCSFFVDPPSSVLFRSPPYSFLVLSRFSLFLFTRSPSYVSLPLS